MRFIEGETGIARKQSSQNEEHSLLPNEWTLNDLNDLSSLSYEQKEVITEMFANKAFTMYDIIDMLKVFRQQSEKEMASKFEQAIMNRDTSQSEDNV